MKNRFRILIVAAAICATTLSGCSKWLDVKPKNELLADEFWVDADDVKGVLLGGYSQTRKCLDKFVQWGELRGDGIDLAAGAANNEDFNNLKVIEIYPNNSVCEWYKIYDIIGRMNLVIKNSPLVMERDLGYSENLANAYVAEATWLRSLAYFYLVRTFNDVPYVVEPYTSDDQDFEMPKSEGKYILEQLVADLTENMKYITSTYEVAWENKGRVTRNAYAALLADIYLLQGNYEKTLEMCDIIDSSNLVSLVEKDEWYSIFSEGNTKESIFELQFVEGQLSTDLYNFYYKNNQAQLYSISDSCKKAFNENELESDIRGLNASYLTTAKIWKFAGAQNDGVSKRSINDANWIIYRYADICMMRAEALIMQGDIEGGFAIIAEIRKRAGYVIDLATPADEESALRLLMAERFREFAFEGKRWFDLVRWAVRDDGRYKSELIDRVTSPVPANMRDIYINKLQDINGFYLPIHEDDIENSQGLLIQNPYYL